MKMLKKLALVSAVSMISAGAFAMEAMDDESMAATSGQDGITIKVGLGTRTTAQFVTGLGVTQATFDQIDVTNSAGVAGADTLVKGLSITSVNIHDDDGLGTMGVSATANSGALVIGGGAAGAGGAAIAADSTVVFADNNATDPIIIKLDMVGDSNGSATVGGGAMLNVAIHTPKLAIKTGAMYVANSNAAPDDFDADGVAAADADAFDTDGSSIVNASKVKIANSMEIVMGAMDINIQLGNESQTLTGAAESVQNPNVMVRVAATIVGGLSINNLQMDDSFQSPSFTAGSTGGGSFRANSLTVTNAGGGNLNALVGVNIANDIGGDLTGGLVVTLGALGIGAGIDVTINDAQLGSATAADMGDIQLLGLNIDGTSLIISGH